MTAHRVVPVSLPIAPGVRNRLWVTTWRCVLCGDTWKQPPDLEDECDETGDAA